MMPKVTRTAFAALFVFFSSSYTSAQEFHEICVIGSGFSGLSAARALHDSLHDVLVLEAKDYVGGRAKTITVGGKTTEAGCMWINGWENKNPSTCLAKAANASKTEYFEMDMDKIDSAIAFNAQTGETFPWKDVAQMSMELENWANLVTVKKWYKSNGGFGNASLMDGTEAFISLLPNKITNPDLFRFVVDQLYAETYYSGPSRMMSFKYYWEDPEFRGKDVMLPVGYTTLINELKKGLTILTQTAVHAISNDISYGSNSLVKTTRGDYICGKVIVTVPLGVLKSDAITFTPPLPATKIDAIQRLGMGILEKVILTFATAPFNGLRMVYYKEGDKTGLFPVIYNVDNVSGGNMLIAWHGGDTSTKTLATMTDAEIVAAMRNQISQMTGIECPEPTGSFVSRWETDPYTRGSYSYIAVSSRPSDRRRLGKQIGNSLYFAGEHTNEYYGTTMGALLSGERVAKEIDPNVSFFYRDKCTA